MEYLNSIIKEVKHIENLEEYTNKLNKKLEIVEKEMTLIAKEISKIRKDKAKILSNKINTELEDLEMKNARISIKIEFKDDEFFKTGKDEVNFYIKTNIGEDEKELIKIASGGEMSRTMLAIKKFWQILIKYQF